MQLLLTLGHNSSAIALDNNGNLIAGYEEERLTRKKSDSSFPAKSIEMIFATNKTNNLVEENNTIYLSHWFDDYDFYKNENQNIKKYYDYKAINELVDHLNFKVILLSPEFTHHDAHAYSVKSFYDYHKRNGGKQHIIVADGFGNQQEVISIYSCNGTIKLLKRIYGYNASLGLMYQYATSYLGLKENQDEYKLLGAETYVDTVLSPTQLAHLDKCIYHQTKFLMDIYSVDSSPKDGSPYIDVAELKLTKKMWHDLFDFVLRKLDLEPITIELFQKQCIIAYYVQSIIENVLLYFVDQFAMQNVLLSGGIFYNVKLNNRIMKHVDSICIIPLAGDQGAAIGLYEFYNPGKFKNNWKNLFWGKRDLEKSNYLYEAYSYADLYFHKDSEETVEIIVSKLLNDEIVQIVSGNMEFGPRALCNTSSLMLPSKRNVDLMNRFNDRSELMPCAPVMFESVAATIFDLYQYRKVIGSLEYMIITLDYTKQFVKENLEKYRGIMHKYPLVEVYSGRPQIIKDSKHIIYRVLKKLFDHEIYALVNTSYNVHGRPIVYSLDNAIDDYRFQLEQQTKLNIDKKICLMIVQ